MSSNSPFKKIHQPYLFKIHSSINKESLKVETLYLKFNVKLGEESLDVNYSTADALYSKK